MQVGGCVLLSRHTRGSAAAPRPAPTPRRTLAHALTYTYIHTHSHPRTHARARVYVCVCARAHFRVCNMRTCLNQHTLYMCPHTHTHTKATVGHNGPSDLTPSATPRPHTQRVFTRTRIIHPFPSPSGAGPVAVQQAAAAAGGERSPSRSQVARHRRCSLP